MEMMREDGCGVESYLLAGRIGGLRPLCLFGNDTIDPPAQRLGMQGDA
jgi:hypothetical protein